MVDTQFDVVVAGCGVAGLSAAVSAAESGARVAVLERAPMEDRGGQSRWTEAYLRMKSLTEVSDDFETHLAENGAGSIDPELVVPMPLEGIKHLFNVYRNPSMESLQRMLDVFVYDTSALTPELIEGRYNNMMANKHHLENFVKSFDANPKQFPDHSLRLPEIKAPTLITWGRDDRFVPLDAGLRLLWGMQDAELHVFSKCGHWAQWEHADKFNRLVIEFLKR